MSDDTTTIDVGSWFLTLLRNWWVIVGLIVIGVVVGAVVTLAQPKEYTATASVYIGQTTDANGNPMAGLNSNAKAAVQLLASQVVLNEAAERSGMDISASLLRKETTVETPSSTVKTSTSVVNIVVISVTDTNKERAAAAANALAAVLLERLEHRREREDRPAREAARRRQEGSCAATAARSAAAQQALAAIANGQRLAGGEGRRLRALPGRRPGGGHRAGGRSPPPTRRRELLLLTAKQVEQPRILHEAAVPDSPSGPSMSLNVAIGALAGLVIGIIVAFARRGLADAARRAEAAAA